jgi:hypothetical protein
VNFKNWEKLREDANSVELKHPQGHTMTIAVKALPKLLQEQIKHLKFAEGGEVDEDAGISQQGKDVRYAQKLKKRGDPEHKMHEDFAKEEAKGRAKAEREMVKPKLKGLAKGGQVHYYEDGSDEGPVSEDDGKSDTPDQAGPSTPPPVTVNVNAAPVQPQPMVKSPMPIVGQSAPVVPAQPQAPEAPQANGSTLPIEARKTLQAQEMGDQGLKLQSQVEAAKAQATAPAQAEALQGEQAIAAQNAKAYNEIMQHSQDFADYINKNPINPKHYQESMSSGQKAATAIGLFLGGLGTSFGGHNYAFDALQKQIDRDIDAQKTNVHNQQTVLGAWQQLYGDNNISTALAKTSMNDILDKKMKLAAAQLGTPQAQANYLMAHQKLMAENNQLRTEAASLAGYSRATGAPPPGSKPVGANPKNGGPQKEQGKGQGKEVDSDHILAPDANNAATKLRYNPLYKEQVPAIMEQKARADLADKAIDSIKEAFPKLYSNTGGAGGYMRRFGHDLHGVPYVGGIADKMVQYGTDTNKNAAYDSDYQNLIGAVRGALQGNVSEDLLNQVVEANRPETNDPKDLQEKKLKNMIDFIKAHTKTDLLVPAGLTRKK